MNNSIIIAVAIVAAAVIVKVPIGNANAGRYQIVQGGPTSVYRLDTATGDGWVGLFPGPHWQPFSDNGARP